MLAALDSKGHSRLLHPLQNDLQKSINTRAFVKKGIVEFVRLATRQEVLVQILMAIYTDLCHVTGLLF